MKNTPTILLLIMLLFTPSCGTVFKTYDEIEFSAGIQIPLPIMPIDVGVKFKLKNNNSTGDPADENGIFDSLVNSGLLDEWLRQLSPDQERRGGGNQIDPPSDGSSGSPSDGGGSEDSGNDEGLRDDEGVRN